MVEVWTAPARPPNGVTVSVSVAVPGVASLGTVTRKRSLTVLSSGTVTAPGLLTVQPDGACSLNSAWGIA